MDTRYASFAAGLILMAAVGPLRGQNQSLYGDGMGLTPQQQLEVHYATRLLEAGMADYSQRVIERSGLPAEVITMLQLRTLGALGKFDEARALIGRRPDQHSAETWSLKAMLADAYFAWGRYGEARGIYTSFFERFPDGPSEDVKLFFIESAYKYAQMLILMGEPDAAVRAFDTALKARPERHIQRQILGEQAELLMSLASRTEGGARTRYLAQAEPIITTLLWVQDVWFGKAIVMLAHSKVLQGDLAEAMRLIEDYTPELRRIDDALKAESEETGQDLTKLSPMAQCRYMLGVMLQDEAENLLKAGDHARAKELLIGTVTGRRQDGSEARTAGALQHFLNVFVRYPNTTWAPEAGNRFQQVRDKLNREFDRDVQVNVTPEQWDAVQRAQFREARVLFNQQQFTEATEAYEKVLTLFPEQEASVRALGELAACYIEDDEHLMVEMIIRYLSERFSRHADFMVAAGDQVVRIAFTYTERGMPERADQAYADFFRFFSRHPRTPGELARYGGTAMRQGDLESAARYYGQLIEDHLDSPVGTDALSMLAQIYGQQENYTNQIATLNTLVERLEASDRPGHMLANSMFRLAQALNDYGRRHDDPSYTAQAERRFRDIENLLSDPEARLRYQNSADEARANERILQGAMFYRAMINAQRQTVPANVQEAYNRRHEREVPPELILQVFKRRAITMLLELVEQFPASDFAPPALSQAGTLYTVLGDAENASATLQRLQREYTDSDYARNARFMVGINLLEIGMRREAIREFRAMFADAGDYSPGQILSAARELVKAGEYTIAAQAFEQVLARSDERSLVEPARVGLGASLTELGRYDEAVEVLERVLTDHPQSGHTIEVSRRLARSYAEQGREESDSRRRQELFNNAVRAMRTARQFAREQGLQTALDVETAQLLVRRARAEARHGAETRAREILNDAIAAYQSVILFRNPTAEDTRRHVQSALAECLPLLVEIERYDDALEDAERYLRLYPQGPHVLDVRQVQTRARVAGGRATGAGAGADDDVLAVEPDEDDRDGAPDVVPGTEPDDEADA